MLSLGVDNRLSMSGSKKLGDNPIVWPVLQRSDGAAPCSEEHPRSPVRPEGPPGGQLQQLYPVLQAGAPGQVPPGMHHASLLQPGAPPGPQDNDNCLLLKCQGNVALLSLRGRGRGCLHVLVQVHGTQVSISNRKIIHNNRLFLKCQLKVKMLFFPLGGLGDGFTHCTD